MTSGSTERSDSNAEPVAKTDEEWRSELSPEQYAVLRQAGTEAPFSGKYVHVKDDGTYRCAACGQELFRSDTKFDSGTGWPSFYEPANTSARRADPRPHARHGPHRGAVQAVRLAPGSRVRRRSGADGAALLHQLARPRARPDPG